MRLWKLSTLLPTSQRGCVKGAPEWVKGMQIKCYCHKHFKSLGMPSEICQFRSKRFTFVRENQSSEARSLGDQKSTLCQILTLNEMQAKALSCYFKRAQSFKKQNIRLGVQMSEFLWCQVSTKRLNDLNWKERREGGGERKKRTVMPESRDNPSWICLSSTLTEDCGFQWRPSRRNFPTLSRVKILAVCCLFAGRAGSVQQ